MMSWFGGMGVVRDILMLRVWVAIVVLIVWAIRASGSPPRPREDQTARANLQRRFVDGEISQTEYARARRLLDGHCA